MCESQQLTLMKVQTGNIYFRAGQINFHNLVKITLCDYVWVENEIWDFKF